MNKKRNLWKWFTGLVVTAGLTVFLAVPPQVAGPVGSAINEQAWGYFDDGNEERSTENQRQPKKRLPLDEGRQTGEGEREKADAALQLREEIRDQGRENFLKKATEAFLSGGEVTAKLDKNT